MISIFSYGSHCSAQFKHSFYDSEIQIGVRNAIGNDFFSYKYQNDNFKNQNINYENNNVAYRSFNYKHNYVD